MARRRPTQVKRAALLAALALILAPPAFASTEATSLEPVASAIAGQPLTVLCYEHGEESDPLVWKSWAYVRLFEPVVHLSREVCDGALAIQSGAMLPLWEQALGALALTHEAYHLKTSLAMWRRESEAQTECRAVKRVQATMRELGASPALVEALYPWAASEHFKISALNEEYDYPSCSVPGFEWWPK